MNKFILINVIFFNLLFSTDGCTDPMAFNCIDDEDYHSYIINAGGIVYDNSCNWGYEWVDDELEYIDENNCDFSGSPNPNNPSCTGYYNPQATIDDGSCRYPQAPSSEDVVITILSESEIHLDWSLFDLPQNADFGRYLVQRCTEESCSWVPGAGPGDQYTETSIVDNFEWEYGNYIKYLFAVDYGNNPYWGWALDYMYITPTSGCTDSGASNYNPDANFDDGSCISLSIDQSNIYNFKLNKIYPNPFNSILIVEFTLKEYDDVSLDIIDLNGKHIDRIFSGTKPSGIYQYTWDANYFSSGIYFIQLSSTNMNIIQTKKIIYLK